MGLILVAVGCGVGGLYWFVNSLGSGEGNPIRPGGALGSLAAQRAPMQESAAESGGKAGPAPEDPWELPSELPDDAGALLAEAEAVMRRLVDRYPNDPDAWEMQARVQFYRGQTADAVESWERCLELNPNYTHALEGLGSAAARQGDHGAAEAYYRRAMILAPESMSARIELARAMIDQAELDEALDILEEAVVSDTAGAEPWVLMGIAYGQQQKHDRAKESYEAALARNPDQANAHWGLATACMRLGMIEEARRHQQEFRRLHAGERDQRQRQRDTFEDLDTIAQDVAGMYVQSAAIWLAHENASSAETVLQRAALLNPQDVNSRQALAWLYLQSQRPQGTIDMLQELADLEPHNTSYPLEIARLYESQQQWKEAEKTLQSLVEARPEDAAAHASLARFYLRTNAKPGEALALSRKAVELEPIGHHYAVLATVFEQHEDLASAITSLRQALDREPENADYRQMLERLQRELAASRQ